jgi:hypothetical protein
MQDGGMDRGYDDQAAMPLIWAGIEVCADRANKLKLPMRRL